MFPTWAEFKVFLWKNFGKTRVFIYEIWKKFYKAGQYQLKEVIDWSVYIEHLESILKEFKSVVAPMDDLLIWYFCNGMRPSIFTQLDKKDRKLDDWQAVIKHAVDVEANAVWQAPLLMWKSQILLLQPETFEKRRI